jgi:hypothetical protein
MGGFVPACRQHGRARARAQPSAKGSGAAGGVATVAEQPQPTAIVA